LESLQLTASAESDLENAIQGRSLHQLQEAIKKAEDAGVGVVEPSGLLHTGRILCTRMEAESDAMMKLVSAIHQGSDAGLLREALNEVRGEKGWGDGEIKFQDLEIRSCLSNVLPLKL
jgi:hypothetical protein